MLGQTEGQLVSETGSFRTAWKQVLEKVKKQLSVFLTFINPKIHKTPLSTPGSWIHKKGGSCQP